MRAPAEELAARLADVRGRIAAAAARAGRDPAAVTLVAVAKSAPAEIYGVLADAGLRDVGESRVQAAAQRRPAAGAAPLRWHLVGHLQSNKARRAVELFDVLHGVDSPELLLRLERAAVELGRAPELLLQLNLLPGPAGHGETGRHGLRPDELPAALAAARTLRAARVTGLMTMAAEDAGEAAARTVFRELAELRRRHAEPDLPLPHLSMGMSDDFPLAVEEGATLVRVGRRLVEGVLPGLAPRHGG